MKTTMHCGRKGLAKHNDRTFLKDKNVVAEHIDLSKTGRNAVYLMIPSADGQDLEAAELAWYRKAYGEALEVRNGKYRLQGHPERCRTMEQVYRAARTRPEEVILQLGDHVDQVPEEVLAACVQDYVEALQDWASRHGGAFQILDVALHYDEATPHAHLRRVWQYRDDSGFLDIGQSRALAAAGVQAPDPDRPQGRYNNAKMTFDKHAREIWQDIAVEHGLEVDRTPIPGRRHLSKADYIRQANKDLEARSADLEARVRIMSQTEASQTAQDARKTLFGRDKVVIDQGALDALRQAAGVSEAALRDAGQRELRARRIMAEAAEQAEAVLARAREEADAVLRQATSARVRAATDPRALQDQQDARAYRRLRKAFPQEIRRLEEKFVARSKNVSDSPSRQ